MAVVAVPKILRDKLGEEGADALVSLINDSNDSLKADMLTLVEERFERRLSQELAKMSAVIAEQGALLGNRMTALEARILEQGAAFDTRFTAHGAALDRKLVEWGTSLEVRLAEHGATLTAMIANTRADVIRWMFIFWVGQIGAVLGFLIAFLPRSS